MMEEVLKRGINLIAGGSWDFLKAIVQNALNPVQKFTPISRVNAGNVIEFLPEKLDCERNPFLRCV